MAGTVTRKHRHRTQRVVMYGYDDAQILDISGPLEVFARSARWLVDHHFTDVPPYVVELIADFPGLVRCSSGLKLYAERSFREVNDADIVLVSGGIGYRKAVQNAVLIQWLQQQTRHASRIGSICSGSLILASAGLLDNCPATTHWAYYDKLAAASPSTRVEKNAIYVRAGNIYTSAGVLSGMDLALGIVEEEWGTQVAVAVAQELVMFTVRRGSDSQMSPYLEAMRQETDRIQKLMLWMLENPGEDLSVTHLAERTAMSARNFTRRFVEELGQAPGKFVDDLRFNAARRKLEHTKLSIDRIATDCGFGSASALRRIFARRNVKLNAVRKPPGAS